MSGPSNIQLRQLRRMSNHRPRQLQRVRFELLDIVSDGIYWVIRWATYFLGWDIVFLETFCWFYVVTPGGPLERSFLRLSRSDAAPICLKSQHHPSPRNAWPDDQGTSKSYGECEHWETKGINWGWIDAIEPWRRSRLDRATIGSRSLKPSAWTGPRAKEGPKPGWRVPKGLPDGWSPRKSYLSLERYTLMLVGNFLEERQHSNRRRIFWHSWIPPDDRHPTQQQRSRPNDFVAKIRKCCWCLRFSYYIVERLQNIWLLPW